MMLWLVVQISKQSASLFPSSALIIASAFLYTTSRVVEDNLVFHVILRFPPLLGDIPLFLMNFTFLTMEALESPSTARLQRPCV